MKNTVFLYIRMIVVTLVSFFTIRITLRLLGVEDYGIYNVVAGIVSFLGIISATMASATQRYLAYDLGKEDLSSFQNTFSLLLLVYAILSIIVVVVGETIGPWLISSYLKIPNARLVAAQWVFQFALASFCLTLISTPYQASIIAYEKMGAFAFVGLFDALGKLFVTLLLYIIAYDKLITYSFFVFCISVVIFLFQFYYCKIKLKGCTYRYYWNKSYLKEIISYTGWNLFGAASGTLNTAGISLVLNLFFGPLVNAAKGIADRIQGMVVSFSVNFYQAIAPQIIKTYAAGETERTKMIVYRSSKLSFFLLYAISLPVICGMPTLLNIWLGAEQVTEDMIVFSRLVLLYSIVNIFEQPLTMLIRATGNIKKYQISVGMITLSTIPFCIVLFLLGFPAYWTFITLTIVFFVAIIIRLLIARSQVGLSIKSYSRIVFLPISIVCIISGFFVVLLVYILRMNDTTVIVLSFFITSLTIWLVGLKKDERELIIMRVKLFNKK